MKTNDVKETNLHSDHRKRMRSRCLNSGMDNFENHQILEILLFYCIPRKDTNNLAHEILNEYGSLSDILNANPFEFQNRCGVSEITAVFFYAMAEYMKRCSFEATRPKSIIDSATAAGRLAISLLAGSKNEKFFVICLDSQKRFLNATLISEGTVDESAVYSRIVMEVVLRFKTTSVLFTHNHPGGSLVSSKADIDLTTILTNVLNSVGIAVDDHIIVADGSFMSMAKKGLVKNYLK